MVSQNWDEWTWERQDAERWRLAREFAATRGWTVSLKPFGLRMLARGIAGGGGEDDLVFELFDHAEFYRTKGSRQVAAIAAHLYDFEYKADDCAALAERYGLTLEILEPSWYLPGRTQTVLYLGPRGLQQ